MSLAAIAPGLSEAELRVALHLATIQDPEHHSARASSRELAEATRVSRSNVVRAIDSLTRRCLIATRQGTGQKASAYLLNFTQTARLPSGPTAGPLSHPRQAGLVLQQDQSSKPQAPIDIEDPSIYDSMIDRVLTARPNHFQRSELDTLRSYAYKWLTIQRGQHNAQPPDDLTLAQIATAAGSTGAAVNLIVENLQDRQAMNCQYLVSMALQRLHGIAPATLKRRRAQLRMVRSGHQAPQPAPADEEAHTPTQAQPEPDPEYYPSVMQRAIGDVRNLR